ncbi:hypothetical protein PPACK8108_LOCUS4436, partial [Phakopsora pachyrhizi]
YIFLILFLLFLLILFFFFPFLLFYLNFNSLYLFLFLLFLLMGIDDLALLCTPFFYLFESDPIGIVLDCVVLLFCIILSNFILFDL